MALLLRGLLGSLCLVILAGCKKEVPRPEPPAEANSGGALARTPAPPSASAVEEKAPSPPRVDEAPQQLHFAAWRPTGFFWPGELRKQGWRLHRLKNRVVFTQAGFPFLIENGKLKLDAKALSQGPAGSAVSIDLMMGQWPDNLWVKAAFDPTPGGALGPRMSDLTWANFRKSDSKWKKIESVPYLAAIGSDDALTQVTSKGIQRAEGDGPAPKPGQILESPGGQALAYRALASSPDGAWLAAGYHTKSNHLAIERWSSTEAASVIEEIPGVTREDQPQTFFLSFPSSTQAALGVSKKSRNVIARLDGQRWIEVPPPAQGNLKALQATADGALWIWLDRNLWKLHHNTWIHYPIPREKSCELQEEESLLAIDAETAYLGGYVSTRKGESPQVASVIYGTKAEVLHGNPPRQLVNFCDPEGEDSAKKAAQIASLAPPASAAPSTTASAPPPASATSANSNAEASLPTFTPGCKTPFVVLYDISKNSPADFNFPTTRKALSSFPSAAQIKLVEYRHGGRRRLGVEVSSGEVGEALVKHIQATMKDESPSLACYRPEEGRREIPLS